MTPSLYLNILNQYAVKAPTPLCFNNIHTVIYQENDTIKAKNTTNDTEQILLSLNNEKLISPVFLNKNKNKLAFISYGTDYYVYRYDLLDKNINKIPLGNEITNPGIINFDILDDIYIYYQQQDNNQYAVGWVNNGKINKVIEGITYSGSILTKAVEPINNLIIYPQCNQTCQLLMYKINEKKTGNINIATEDNSPQVNNLDSVYYDENLGKLIYQNSGKKIAYISDLNGYLWHHIYLEPSGGNLIQLNGIVVDRTGRKKLLASSLTNKQAYLYDINYIGLQILDLSDKLHVINSQVSEPQGCFFITDNEEKEVWVKDFATEKDKKLTSGVKYLVSF